MILRMINKVNYIFNRKQKTELVFLLIFVIIGSLLETLGVSAILPLVEIVTTPEVVESNKLYGMVMDLFGLRETVQLLLYGAWMLVFLYIFKNVFIILEYDFQNKYICKNQWKLSTEMMSMYLRQEYLFHTEHNVAEIQRNICTDVDSFFSAVKALISLFSESLTCFCLIVFLMSQDIITTLCVLVMMGIYMLYIATGYRKRLVRLGEKNRKYGSERIKWIIQSFEGIKEIKSTGNEKFFGDAYADCFRKNVEIVRKQTLMELIPRPVVETVLILGLLGALIIRIYGGQDLKSFVPTLSVFALAAIRMLPSFNRISGYISSISFNSPSVDAIYEDVHTYDLKQSQEISKAKVGGLGEISCIDVQGVSFSYPSRADRKVLDHVNMTIKAYSLVAFVGASGAGKTTLADLIMGIMQPTEGKILLDGKDLKDYVDAWHHTVGYIPQTIYLLDDSLRQNIVFGCDREYDEKWMDYVLEQAQLLTFIKDLPDGLDTQVGEMGVKLSGGQRQRVGIARALYRNPQVLVLDEATAALDNETEKAIMEAINRLSGKTTLIVIAHRLTTVRNADVVYEIQQGKVIARSQEWLREQINHV